MRYVLLALMSVVLSSPMLVGCESNSEHTTTTSKNPITGTVKTTETNSSHTDTNNNP
jgi:hypothetical protein